jgi:hypothetical protein
MSDYIINFTDPTKSTITVSPGSVKGPSGGLRATDLDLIGMGSNLWGEKVNENLLHLLENFASPEDHFDITAVSLTGGAGTNYITLSGDKTLSFVKVGSPLTATFTITGSTGNDGTYSAVSASYAVGPNTTTIVITEALSDATVNGKAGTPSRPDQNLTFGATTPIQGQLWYNSDTGHIFVFDTSWSRVGGFSIGDTAPTTAYDSELWWDTAIYAANSAEYRRELHFYYNGMWNRVSDDYLTRSGSKPMTGALDMNSNQINNLADPALTQDAMTLSFADGRYLNVTGDTLSGDLDMASNQLLQVGDPTADSSGMSRHNDWSSLYGCRLSSYKPN